MDKMAGWVEWMDMDEWMDINLNGWIDRGMNW